MASVYTNDLRLEEIGSGEQSGTWGDTTNTNLELIAEAFSFGTEAITTNADTHATTIADGATDAGRSMFLKYTGTLDSACTITIGPNTVSKLWFIENGTSGSQNIIISQGSGANITIPPGDTKAIYSDGAGSGAAMVDAFASLSVVDLKVQDDLSLTSDSAVLNIGADNDLKITHDGTNGDFESAGDLTLDVAGDINLDADGGDINLKDGGTAYAHLSNSSSDLFITNPTADKDIHFRGNDGGSFISALTLDMSDAGTATFNHDIKLASDGAILNIGAGNDLKISHSGSAATINNDTGDLSIQTDGNLKLEKKDGGEDFIHCIADGAVELHHNGTKTFETTSAGATVTGSNFSIDATSGGRSFDLIVDSENSYLDVSHNLILRTNGASSLSEKVRIESGGNVLIGRTDSGSQTEGTTIYGGGQIEVTNASDLALRLNRKTDNGTILELRKDAGIVGTLGYQNTGFVIDGEANHSGIRFSGDQVAPRLNKSDDNGSIDLGGSSNRFRDAYLAGNVIISGSGKGINFAEHTAQSGSTSQILDRYEEGSYDATLTCGSGSITLDLNALSYTIIGRNVYINGRVHVSAVSSPSGNTFISLPIASGTQTADNGDYNSMMAHSYLVNLPSGTVQTFWEISPGTSVGLFLAVKDDAVWENINANNIAVGDIIYVSGHYVAAT